MKGGESDEDEQVQEPIMNDWELISLNKDGVDFRFNFSQPLTISTGDEPDLILV